MVADVVMCPPEDQDVQSRSSRYSGYNPLSEEEALSRLQEFGPNEIPVSRTSSIWNKLKKLIAEPMLLLLIVVAGVYVVLGDFREGLMLGFSVFVVMGIFFYQERRSEKALMLLRDLSSPRALVLRNNQERRIPANLLVPGDIVVLREGDRVPADGNVLEARNLSVDESLLTGESVPVQKALDGDCAKVFSSTLVTTGSGIFRVTETGPSTQVGKIGKSLDSGMKEEPGLSREIRQLVRIVAFSGFLICLIIFVSSGIINKDWLQALLQGLATQMALMPEEFPVVLAVFLALGAWRLSKVHVLVRQPRAIETLGGINVLCVDKTGTLTQNRMTVTEVHVRGESVSFPAANKQITESKIINVLKFGMLASHRDAFDPMEKAIRKSLIESDWKEKGQQDDWKFVREYSLSAKFFAMSCVWRSPESTVYFLAAKGAPEAIMDLCRLRGEERQAISRGVSEMASRGLRVLGVARAEHSGDTLPDNQTDFIFEYVGLIGFEDPLRDEVPSALRKCQEAGIRVLMMTGDYPDTAVRIAQKAGLENSNRPLTGIEISRMTDEELKRQLQASNIFARMIPDEKLRIVKLLQQMNYVVAMTGDGVNDAPSLKFADVGIAMGGRGTDVAREASDLVLLDDNFSSIVSGIDRGRMIFSNLRKALGYIVSIHIPIAGLSVVPIFLGLPMLLLPLHIVLLELIIDPACTLLFESYKTEEGAMNVPPRSLQERLFGRRDIFRSLFQGFLVFLFVLGVLAYSMKIWNEDFEIARSLAFAVLVFSNLGLIFADLTDGQWKKFFSLLSKKSTYAVTGGVLGVVLALTTIQPLAQLFNFHTLSVQDLALGLLFGALVFILLMLINKIALSRAQ